MTTSHTLLILCALVLPVPRAFAQTPAPAVQADSSSAHAGTVVDAEAVTAADDAVIPLTPGLEKRARALNEQLRCPVCQSSSIEESPAFEATEMKSVVRSMLAEGKSDEEIVEYFQSRYGDWVLLAPPKRGFNLMVYVLPVLLVLGGAVFVYRTARRYVGASAGV